MLKKLFILSHFSQKHCITCLVLCLLQITFYNLIRYYSLHSIRNFIKLAIIWTLLKLKVGLSDKNELSLPLINLGNLKAWWPLFNEILQLKEPFYWQLSKIKLRKRYLINSQTWLVMKNYERHYYIVTTALIFWLKISKTKNLMIKRILRKRKNKNKKWTFSLVRNSTIIETQFHE